MAETPLADLIPLWRTFREEGVTCLLTPALDYVGALELGTIDARFAGEVTIEGIGDSLRQVIGSLADGDVLHFLYRAEVGTAEEEIREYEALCEAAAPGPAIRAYVADRAAWLRRRALRKARLFLFFSHGDDAGLTRGVLGRACVYRLPRRFSAADHAARLQGLAEFRDRLAARLRTAGFPSRELTLEEIWRIHFQLLNPTRSQTHVPPRAAALENIHGDEALTAFGAWLGEYSEPELLIHEDVEQAFGYFRHGDTFRRAHTFKILPEGGTGSDDGAFFLRGLTDGGVPFPYTLSVTVGVKHQGKEKRRLNTRHRVVEQLKDVIPWMGKQSVSDEAAEQAQQESIRALFAEMQERSLKIASLSMTVLVDAPSLDVLARRTEAIRAAAAATRNAQIEDETRTQIPAFVSVLPSAGPYQLRKKGCTSANAADLLPMSAAWRGTTRAASVLETPEGDVFRFDPFDKKIVNAHHGVVVADTGSGKSFTMGAILLDAIASGVEAVLVDNGGSWKALTEILGGVHVPVDLSTSISPFVGYEAMLDPATGELSNEDLEMAVNFIEVCVQDRTRLAFDKVEKDAVSKAIRWCYETRFRERPTARPLIGDFAAALKDFPWTRSDDRRIAEDLSRRLEIFTTGIYRDLLNKPSTLKLDVPLLTFEMSKVAENPTTRAIAMATMIQAISNRAQRRQRATIIAIDEAHEYIGGDEATGLFLARAWRKFRKYGCAMYAITQKLPDFLANPNAREAILGNSTLRYFLRHMKGNHGPVSDHFQLPARAASAFQNLSMKPGHYSDIMLMYGPQTSVIRMAVTPLAYWILTTDKQDKDLIARAREKNPRLSQLAVLQELAARYPNGLVGAANR